MRDGDQLPQNAGKTREFKGDQGNVREFREKSVNGVSQSGKN